MIKLPELCSKQCERVSASFTAGSGGAQKRILPGLATSLREEGFEVIISGDPCYGACDADLHARDNAEVLVHIGHTPVDDTQGVLYETWPVNADLTVIKNVIPLLSGTKAGLVTTIQHVHLLKDAAKI